MSISLFQHWKDLLDSCSGLCERVYRFLLRYYGDQARKIVFRPRSLPVVEIHLQTEAHPKLPKSPDQIRSLLIRIGEAVRASTSRRSL